MLLGVLHDKLMVELWFGLGQRGGKGGRGWGTAGGGVDQPCPSLVCVATSGAVLCYVILHAKCDPMHLPGDDCIN